MVVLAFKELQSQLKLKSTHQDRKLYASGKEWAENFIEVEISMQILNMDAWGEASML